MQLHEHARKKNGLSESFPAWPAMTIHALRRLPAETPGKARLARVLLRGIRSREDVTVKSAAGASFLVPHLAEPVGFHLLIDGRYEPDTEDLILRHLGPGDAFIDAGANIGVLTISAARRVGEGGMVLAIEPSPSVFPYLERNIAMNGLANVVTARVAVSDSNRDEVPFYAAPADHFGMGALTPQFHRGPCPVMTRTLDHLVEVQKLDHVSVLKIDVEGHEAAVLRGAEKLLARSPGLLVIFEFCDWAEGRFEDSSAGQAQRFLIDIGYQLWRLKDYGKKRKPLEAPLTQGSAMLVAQRSNRRRAGPLNRRLA
jgi:FkbM family methyltransferase